MTCQESHYQTCNLDHIGSRRIKHFISRLDTVHGISRSSLRANGTPKRMWEMCPKVSVSFLLGGWTSDRRQTHGNWTRRRITEQTRWKSECASSSDQWQTVFPKTRNSGLVKKNRLIALVHQLCHRQNDFADLIQFERALDGQSVLNTRSSTWFFPYC